MAQIGLGVLLLGLALAVMVRDYYRLTDDSARPIELLFLVIFTYVFVGPGLYMIRKGLRRVKQVRSQESGSEMGGVGS